MHPSLCCAYTQGYPYILYLYILFVNTNFLVYFHPNTSLLYSTKCNTVTLHLPIYFVKYAVHARQLDELLLLFLVLAQQPDNGPWTQDPPPSSRFWEMWCFMRRSQYLAQPQMWRNRSPYLWPKGHSNPAIPLGTGWFWTSGVSLPVLTITVSPWGGQMNYLTLIFTMVKNEWSYTSTPPVYLHGLYEDNFTFILTNFNFNNLVNESCSLILPLDQFMTL
jgi:hypothetical protein